jgi:hypothetical protein
MKPTAEEFSHGASLLDCLLLAIPLPHPTTPHCVMGLFRFRGKPIIRGRRIAVELLGGRFSS